MASAVSKAITSIYRCATDPSSWPMTLQEIADCFDDVGALIIHQRVDGSLATLTSQSLLQCVESYQNKWWRQDIRAARALGYLYDDVGSALTDRHVVTEDELATHPIYTEFLAPFGLRWTASVQVSPKADVQVGLSVLRLAARKPFGDDELALLTDLGTHCEQSLRLGLRLIEAEASSFGLGDALGRLAVGALVVDAEARILFSNAAAERLMGRVFTESGRRLTCPAAADGRRLAALLSNAVSDQPKSRPCPQKSPLIVSHDAGRWAIYVIPIRDQTVGGSHKSQGFQGAWGAGDHAAPSSLGKPLPAAAGIAAPGSLGVVMAMDLSPGAPLDPGLVRDVYGLTLGESRVAALVGAGVSPRETALRLSLAEETVRSVLKRVFNKLDVGRQGELVELFSRLKTAAIVQT